MPFLDCCCFGWTRARVGRVVLKARGVLGTVVGGDVIESAAVARAREATPSCEGAVWRMLVRVGLRRPRRPFGVNIVRCCGVC